MLGGLGKKGFGGGRSDQVSSVAGSQELSSSTSFGGVKITDGPDEKGSVKVCG